MYTSTLLLLAGSLLPLTSAGYQLQDDYSAGNFFDMFDFYTVRCSLVVVLVLTLQRVMIRLMVT